MKVEWLSNDKLVVYYTLIFDNILDYEVEDVKTLIKLLVIRLRKQHHLALQGYYHLDVYINKIMILEFEQIDEYEEEIDLNIVLHLNHSILASSENRFATCGKQYFYQGRYYMDILLVDLEKEIEFLDFHYKEEAEKVKKEGMVIP